ncbi:MAG: hypothetical protein AAF990_28680 [Bacteroidota bacterium]
MPKIFTTAAVLLILALGFGKWEEFKSYDGRFRIMVPGPLELRTKQIETEIGDIYYHTYMLQSNDDQADNLVYMISYCDYPEGSVHSDSTALLEEFFDTTVETAMSSVNGNLRYSSKVQLKDYPGRIWRIDYNDDQAVIKTKCFLVGSRYYSIQAITVKDRSLNPAMDRFFDSFELLE